MCVEIKDGKVSDLYGMIAVVQGCVENFDPANQEAVELQRILNQSIKPKR